MIELFDLENDPEELDNVYAQNNAATQALLEELNRTLRQADQPYRE